MLFFGIEFPTRFFIGVFKIDDPSRVFPSEFSKVKHHNLNQLPSTKKLNGRPLARRRFASILTDKRAKGRHLKIPTMQIVAPLYNFNDCCGPLGQIMADGGRVGTLRVSTVKNSGCLDESAMTEKVLDGMMRKHGSQDERCWFIMKWQPLAQKASLPHHLGQTQCSKSIRYRSTLHPSVRCWGRC